MKKFIQKTSVAALLLILIPGMTATATDGYFSLGYGTKSKGLAGAGLALYSSQLIGGNPAARAWIGNEFEFNVSMFNPNREYTITGNPSGVEGSFGLMPGTVKSDKPIFFIPSIGGNWELGKATAFGFSIYGNGGMNTEYPTSTFYGADPTGVNLSQLFTDITFSYKLADNHSIGISAMLGYQMFKATGLEAFGGFSQDNTKLTGNGNSNSFGFGVKIGYLGDITDAIHIAAQYQSKMYMSEFDEYAGLFAEHGDFDVPSVWTVGVALDVSRDLTIVADVKQINYTDVKAVSNPLGNLFSGPDGALGGSDGGGFGWQDMTIFKAGAEFTPGQDDMTYRLGVSYGKQPIPESEVLFNILAPAVSEMHFSAGITKEIDPRRGNAFSLSVMYSPDGSVSGSNPLDQGQTIELKMNQLEVSLGYSF